MVWLVNLTVTTKTTIQFTKYNTTIRTQYDDTKILWQYETKYNDTKTAFPKNIHSAYQQRSIVFNQNVDTKQNYKTTLRWYQNINR